ncbi:MAG: L-threonylcarbamoyladenylate synthase [Thermonemataceae bacterium]|mgnify:CR=1 FL=1
MAATFLKIHPENPEPRKMKQVVDCLSTGGLVIYPTDTVYGLGCDLHNKRALEKICQIKGIKPKKANFSFICYDLSHISVYAKVSTPIFKIMKKALPGPFTFILNATSKVPELLYNNKKTVGIRIPDHPIPRLLVRELDRPIITTSVHDDDEVIDYITSPDLIYEKFQHKVDIVVDGGYGNVIPSTIVDCTQEAVEIVREGAGDIDTYM